MIKNYTIADESQLTQLAKALVTQLDKKVIQRFIIFLNGDLGAGKTTFAKAFIRACGFDGLVKSPTYTLVEEYKVNEQMIYHMDWYRLQDETALEEMGLFEYFHEEAIILTEWPIITKHHQIPSPDLTIDFEILQNHRKIILKGVSEKGKGTLNEIND